MRFTTAKFLLLILLGAVQAHASDGILSQLGEKRLDDQIVSDDASKKPVDARALKNSDTPGISAYNNLDQFNDTVILQKKYLPKRHRFEAGAAYGSMVDNAFFNTKAIYARLGYYVTEPISLEAIYFAGETKQSKVADSLLNNGGVASSVAAAPAHYYGLDAKWTPIYGKLAFWNRSIIPVEQYFLVGLGRTGIDGQDRASTVHFGTGLSFAVRQYLSIRAGLDIFSYAVANGDHFNDTHLNIGFSTFFPQASYR